MAGAAGLLAKDLSNSAFGRIANLQLWLQSPGRELVKPCLGSARPMACNFRRVLSW